MADARVGWVFLLTSENMRGWTEHFMNRYVICGRLVNNGTAVTAEL